MEWQTRGPQKAVPITRREGSSPSLVTGSHALVVKRTSCDFPKVEAQVRLLAGVLVGGGHPRGVPAARDRAKVEGEVRLLTGIWAGVANDGGYGVVALHATL